MKKIISILLFFTVLVFFGCENFGGEDTGGGEEKYISSGVDNKLSQSVGENELTGKTVKDEDMQFVFTDKTVTSSKVSSASAKARTSTESDFAKSTFNYSYNTTAKTLEFQLAGIWENENATGAQNYNSQVTLASAQYNILSTGLLALLKCDSLYSALEGLSQEYKDKIKNSVTSKAENYVQTQKSILNDYLKAKYESVIHFGYELTETQLILTEQFKNDLTSASAKFVGTIQDTNSNTITITLNDYENIIPFKIELPGETEDEPVVYIGVPKIEVATDTTGTITVDLFSYPGNMLESSTDVIEEITNDITQSVRDLLIEALESEDKETIGNQLESGSSSETLDGYINEAIGSFKFVADYTINGNNLTFELQEDGCPSFLNIDTTINLTYTPLLGATYNIVK